MSYLQLVTIVVPEYDPAIRFFVDVLGFDLVEDSPSTTNDGRPKRWVVVRRQAERRGFSSRALTAMRSARLRGIKREGASRSSCGLMSSTRPMSG